MLAWMEPSATLTNNNVSWDDIFLYHRTRLGVRVMAIRNTDGTRTCKLFDAQSLAWRATMVSDCASCALCGCTNGSEAWFGAVSHY